MERGRFNPSCSQWSHLRHDQSMNAWTDTSVRHCNWQVKKMQKASNAYVSQYTRPVVPYEMNTGARRRPWACNKHAELNKRNIQTTPRISSNRCHPPSNRHSSWFDIRDVCEGPDRNPVTVRKVRHTGVDFAARTQRYALEWKPRLKCLTRSRPKTQWGTTAKTGMKMNVKFRRLKYALSLHGWIESWHSGSTGRHTNVTVTATRQHQTTKGLAAIIGVYSIVAVLVIIIGSTNTSIDTASNHVTSSLHRSHRQTLHIRLTDVQQRHTAATNSDKDLKRVYWMRRYNVWAKQIGTVDNCVW